MARVLLILWLGALLLPAQQQAPPPQEVQKQEEEPPEEDVALTGGEKEYVFNPIQAEKELKIGNFYSKKGSWKAAVLRYREAVKWNPGLAEAWLRLGQSLERAKDKKGAQEAFAKYLELEPEAKNAAEIKKKLSS